MEGEADDPPRPVVSLWGHVGGRAQEEVARSMDSGRVMGLLSKRRGRGGVSDDVALLERAYDLSGSEPEWLRELTEWILKSCGGVAAGASGFELPHGASEVVSVGLPKEEGAGRATRMVNDHIKVMPGTGCSTLSSMRAPDDGQRRAAWERLRGCWSHRDLLGIIGKNSDGTGVIFSAILRQPTVLTPSFAEHWTRMAIHLAAAWRLRRTLLKEAAAQGLDAPEGEAGLAPTSGRVTHAVGPARTAPARTALQRAVRAMHEARGCRRHRHDPVSAAELWQGLVAGRWSLVDRWDSDGRRYYVAHKNAPQTPEPRALNERERQVVVYAVQGHPNKLIAYELGLDSSTVANHLRAARSKLGVRSRTELVRVARLLAQDKAAEAKAAEGRASENRASRRE